MTELYIVTESYGINPVATLYYVKMKISQNTRLLETMELSLVPKVSLLNDETSRMRAKPDGDLIYRFKKAGNLTHLLFTGEQNDN